MIRDRLHIDESKAQYTTSMVLSVHAFVGLITGIPTGYIADKISSRQASFLVALIAEAMGTILVMIATNGISASNVIEPQTDPSNHQCLYFSLDDLYKLLAVMEHGLLDLQPSPIPSGKKIQEKYSGLFPRFLTPGCFLGPCSPVHSCSYSDTGLLG